MSEDKVYKDGDIVWVKLGNNWWPGEVTGPTRHPEGLIKHLKRVPYCVVKFFDENTYEYVRSSKQIFPFQCAKQDEFIRKGFSLYNSGNSFMEKFPSDVEVAKQLTSRKESSIIINDRPDSIVKAILGQPLIRTCDEYYDGSEYREKRRSGDSVTKILNISTKRNNDSLGNENPGTQTSNTSNLPNDKTKNITNSAVNNSSNYQCNFCDFTSVRLNVMILHRKMHSNRNSVGSSNSISKQTNAKSAPVGAGTTTTTTNINIDRNQLQQNLIINKGKNINKTKVNTTTAARKARTPSPLKETTAAVSPVSKDINVAQTTVIPLTSKEKHTKITKLQTLAEKSKTSEKTTGAKKKEENVYATILSDFCSSETETSPSSEEKISRRSLRHCKNINENSAGEVSTIFIDLSETKTIQKIPKKREYSLLQLQNESSTEQAVPVVVPEPDVVCLGDKEKETTAIATSQSDAEDIRRMLLADWSDDDETANDAIVVENVECNECVFAAVNEQHASADIVITSTPVVKPSSASTGRIRNIPKKDRRDVVLQDFNSLSLMQIDNADNATKTVAVDLDSSNSSVVEIIEDKQPAAIITINDDEEQMKNQTDLSVTESKDNDSAVGLTNDKSASAATSTTTLSCFDFQEDEDEQDNTTTTISHFKKKYLSGDKLQNILLTTTNEIREDNVTKSRAEMAEKDQRLAAEIETLLEQTHPPVSDLLNANSFEENMSVKDLPIKERGKRIFKSRNKNRIEDKTNAEVVAVTTVEVNLPIAAETIEKSNVNTTAETEILDNGKDMNESESELKAGKEVNMISDHENSITKKCLVEISSHEILFSTQDEVPTFLEDKQLKPIENKENEDYLPERTKDCVEVSIGHDNKSEDRNEEIEKGNAVTSGKIVDIINNEKSIENMTKNMESLSTGLHESYENNDDGSSTQFLNNQDVAVDQQQGIDEEKQIEEGFNTIDEMQIQKEPEQENLPLEDMEEYNENSQLVKTTTIAAGLGTEGDSQADVSPVQPSDLGDAEKEDISVNNVIISEIQIISQKSLENDSTTETVVPKSSTRMAINSQSDNKELKIFTSEKNDEHDNNKNQQQCSETISKIRVKSPDQLFDQAFVMASKKEQELQLAADSNLDTRLIATTPTDENSSMGASDTGAEFGSPTSMLSEERLPAFRFQNNQTPQQEIETDETVLQICNTQETVQEETNLGAGEETPNDKMKESFPKDKAQFYKAFDQKLLQQRRYSLDLVPLQAEPVSIKRQRLSVDTTTCQENHFEKPQEILMSLPIPRSKSEGKNRPKSRHMKITPRRNVRELFKLHSSWDSLDRKETEKSSSLESVDEIQSIGNIVDTIEKQPSKTENNIAPNNENPSIISNQVLDKITATKEINVNHNETFDNIEQVEITANRNLENSTDKEELNKISENELRDALITKTTSEEKIAETEDKEESSHNIVMQAENEREHCPTTEERNKELYDDNVLNVESKVAAVTEDKSIGIEYTDENNVTNSKNIENIDANPAEILIDVENKSKQSISISLDNSKELKEQGSETPYYPGVPTPTPQAQEVIESENINQTLNIQQGAETNVEVEIDMNVYPLTPIEKEHSNEITNQPLTSKEKEHPLGDRDVGLGTLEANEILVEKVCPLIPLEEEAINDSNTRPLTPEKAKRISDCETLAEPSTPQQPLDMMNEFENNVIMPKKNNVDNEYENVMQIPSTPQAKDLIIEGEPSTPQDIIIECDHNIPAQVTPEKEIIVESDIALANPTQDKDIIIEENLQLEEKETLLAREFHVVQPKESSVSVDIPQESQPNILQTDADKAAEEFLIEFDSIVNHSHSVEEDVTNNTVEDAINAEDLINNIIEEVHEDHQLKQDTPTKSDSPVQYEPLTYTVVAPKNSWNEIFKDSFNRQLPLAKRRQTICLEISDTKEAVACKKQAFDIESILPVNKTIKRTAERKLTLPAIETKLSNSHQSQHNIFALSHNQLALNKKIIPTTKRKLSIEDNITSFIIERPKQPQQPANSASGPPPLQRIRPLSRQGHIISKTSMENLSEPPPLQTNDNLFHELFSSESSAAALAIDMVQKAEGGRVIHQQIISSPSSSSISQNKATDVAKISKNKQIGVDSRGNKYVIIKTPPTDIVVQPTLTSSTASAVTVANNFGTTITIQPLARSASEVSVTKPAKSKNISSTPTTSSRKQQLQQQPMKQISITVPAPSPVEVSNSPEVVAKTHARNRRKAAQTKGLIAAATANNNVNSAKHRQAMEALSRRLSIASEAPPLAKISRTSTPNVHTQISSTSNLTIFGDTQISNIAQQQLIQLQQQQQQQQQQTQTTSSPQPPPIILNKNAHQQSVIKRKIRKVPHQLQQQQQPQLQQQQQITSAKSTQLLQQLQQQQNQVQQQQQHQQIQQQFITQIAPPQPEQSQQQHNPLQPPPLQQMQSQTIPMQQQIVQQSDGIIITSAPEDDNVIDSMQLIALPTQPYPGYSETFLLCKVKGNTCKPVDNVPLYLNKQLNELVPVPIEAIEGGHNTQDDQIEIKASNAPQQLLAGQDNEGNLQIANINCNLVEGEISAGIESDHQMHHHSQQQQIMEECAADENGASASGNQMNDFTGNQEVNTELVPNNGILLNIEGQQVLLDAATFAHLLANPDANTQLISDDGTEYVLTHEVLAALQMQQEQQQALELANATAAEQQQTLDQSGGSDIIAVALASSDLYDNDVLTIDTSQGMRLIGGDGSIVFPAQTATITQQHLTPPAVVTNAILDQSPIMSTLEVPSSIATAHKLQGTQLITVPSHHLATSSNTALGVGGCSNLEDSLAAIGVTTQSSNIPSSLGLPITVTNPNIASKVTSAGPLNEMLQFVSHRPATAAATAAAVAAAALAGESRIFTD